jgi:hypothetical protein
MKKIIVLGSLTLVLFGLSAAASWYLKGLKPATTQAAKDGKPATEKSAEKAQESAKIATPASAPLRSAVRPAFVDSADDAVALAERLRQQNAIIREKETKLADRQKSMDLVYGDVKGERASIDEMRKQVADELKAVEEKMVVVERRRADAEKEIQKSKAELDSKLKNQIEMVSEEELNYKKMAEVFDGM